MTDRLTHLGKMPSLKPARGALQHFRTKYIGGKSDEKIKMPGKSNKFDFTNRPNSGAKLGEIIGSNLQKEAEKVKKDAERLASKARKASRDSSGGSDEVEAAMTTHVIDLKAPSKDLGDDGVCAMADGMEIALRSGTFAACLTLEDLNLASNGITTRSLARLAPIIRLARYELKTINLSGNKVEVVTDEQAQQWEEFLLAFEKCMKMRRLDLSDNLQLGARAMEIFARVHVNEEQVTPVAPGGNHSTLSLVDEEFGQDDDSDPSQVDSVAGDGHVHSKLMDATILPRRCGLRSVPYITLHNIGISDAGALWLSYVLEDHYYPSQLISELNATNAESIVKAYQQNTHSRGIDWTENTSLGKEGVQLLEKTELIREHRLHDNGVAGMLDIIDDAESEDTGSGSRGSVDKTSSRAKPGQRRPSIRSIHTIDGGEHETSELESARKRIMRHIIADNNVRHADLWHSAVKVLCSSRMVRWLSPAVRVQYIGDPLFATSAPEPPSVVPPTPSVSPTSEGGSGLRIDTDKANESKQAAKASYASKLRTTSTGSGDRELVITEVTNTPNTPLRLQRPTHRKGAFSQGTDIVESVSKELNALIVRDDSPLRFVKFQQRRIGAKAAEGKSFRDLRTPSHLPDDVLDRLVSFMVDERDVKICRGEQWRRAIDRGQNRGTVKVEMEWLKKDVSAQVLMLLDSIGCLYYGQ